MSLPRGHPAGKNFYIFPVPQARMRTGGKQPSLLIPRARVDSKHFIPYQ